MKIKPTVDRTKPISAKVSGVKVRYDPDEHSDGLAVPDDLGRALVKTGHWTEVEVKRASRMLHVPKASTIVDEVKAESDDSLQD